VSGGIRSPRLLVFATFVLAVGLSMTSCVSSKERFTPPTRTVDHPVQQTLARLEARINAGDAEGICALYASPSARCPSVWRMRLRASPTPVTLSLRKMTIGCAGDARVTYLEVSRADRRIKTLSVVSRDRPGRYSSLIDVPNGTRLSSLVIPRYGDCEDPGGSAGAPNRDPAAGASGNDR
jgi:hypothetical protein